MRNSTLFDTDAVTHLKIVVIALIASTVFSIIGISARHSSVAAAPMKVSYMQQHIPDGLT